MRTLIEAVLIAAAGLLLGMAGNALSPAGLRIGRDYFPAAAAPEAAPAHPDVKTADPAAKAAEIERQAIERLKARGLGAIQFEEAKALYFDPLYAMGALLFIDARHDEEYAAGHVPNALQFDHYHAERYLNAVLQAAPGTTRIVVYCAGGACEDSEFAAATLADFLPEPSRLCVYVGGIDEWTARGMPIETGERGSGQIQGGSK